MGRRRRSGPREPNGRAARRREDFAPTIVRRAIDDAMHGYGNALFGSVLGQLALRGKIEPCHVAAGQRYAGLSAKYHQATGAPPFSHSGSLEMGMHEFEPDVDTPRGRELSMTERSVITRMRRAEHVLMLLGRSTVCAVHDACVLDIDPLPWRYDSLRAGLDSLAQLWFPDGRSA